ncbi:hypothetical protein J6590_104541 [Homalodisca vitripennis]|nr:hypothetical protein J6590_104541 [Homalodisca vitripennis]
MLLLVVGFISHCSLYFVSDSQQDQCSDDKDLFLCVDELFEDEPGSRPTYQTNQDNLTCLEMDNNLRSSPLNPEQAATAEIVENFIEDINEYEEEFWDDSDWEPFGEESDESENEFSSIKRSNKRKASRQLFAPRSKKATILTGQSNNPLPLAHQSNTQDSSSNGRKENQNTNITDLPEVDCTNTNKKRKQSVRVLKTCSGKKRSVSVENWQSVKAKRLKNLGLEYVSPTTKKLFRLKQWVLVALKNAD